MSASESNLQNDKWCNAGQHLVSRDQFSKNIAKKDGLQVRCKDCQSAYGQRNATRIAARNKKHREANAEQLKAKKREYHAQHRDRLNQKANEYYRANRDQTVEVRRERSRRYYEANREMLLAKGKERYWSNLDTERARKKRSNQRESAKILAREAGKRFYNNHRAKALAKAHRRRAAVGCFSSEQWLAKCEYWGWRCYLCGSHLGTKTATVDHRKSLYRGGLNWPSNLAPACRYCNAAKKHLSEAEYRQLIANGLTKHDPLVLTLRKGAVWQ